MWLQQSFPLPSPYIYFFFISWLLIYSYGFYYILSLLKWMLVILVSGETFQCCWWVFLEEKSPDNTWSSKPSFLWSNFPFTVRGIFSFRGSLGCESQPLPWALACLCPAQCLELNLSWTVHKICWWDVWTWTDITRTWLGTEKIPVFQVLGDCSSESRAVDGMEEMELSAAEQEQDIIMCSPEKETNPAQSGEPQIHQPGASVRAAGVALLGPSVILKITIIWILLFKIRLICVCC